MTAARVEATVLHDFFVDRLVLVGSLKELTTSLGRKARRGGGGIHGVNQVEMKGGNAVNMAYALARLGTGTFLITHSDEAHDALLLNTFRNLAAKVSIKRREAGLTVAVEEIRGRRRVNVMLGHLGGAGSFPPSLITAEDWSAMKSSRIICSTNWAANSKGTELLRSLREELGEEKTIYLAPADVRNRPQDYARLLREIRDTNLLDWISLNEFEAKETARLLRIPAREIGSLCLDLAKMLGVRVDLHTERISFSSDGSEVVSCRSRRVNPRRLTGAGDVWDAASVHFFLKGYKDSTRLAFANEAAAYYLESVDADAPDQQSVERLLLEHS